MTHHCIGGKWTRTDERCPPEPPPPTGPCTSGAVRKRVCWNGSEIETYRCIDGIWTKTHEKCPPEPPEEAYCCDLLEAIVYLNQCLPFWRQTEPCQERIVTEMTSLRDIFDAQAVGMIPRFNTVSRTPTPTGGGSPPTRQVITLTWSQTPGLGPGRGGVIGGQEQQATRTLAGR